MTTKRIEGVVRDPNTGAGQGAVTVTVKKVSDGSTVTSTTTDNAADVGYYSRLHDVVGYPGPTYDEYTYSSTTKRRDGRVHGQLAGLLWADDVNDVTALLGIGVTSGLAVSASGVSMAPAVSAGMALLKDGLPYILEAASSVTLSAADATNPRIDRIVLRLTREGQTDQGKISLTKITGTAAASPTAPALTQTSATWDLSLAQVRVNAGVTTIAADKVTDERVFLSVHRPYYVPDYATDGITCNTAAVTAALAAMGTGGGSLIFPAGSHTCDITITKHGVVVQGAGPKATILTGDITWNTIASGDGYGNYPNYYAFRDLQLIGTMGVTADEIPYWLEASNCIFDNSTSSGDWNIDMAGVDSDDVGQNWLFEHCQFRNGGVRLRSVNTATFVRCRFGWSTQAACIWLERSAAAGATENCTAEFIGCVIEGNDKTGVYLGPGAQRCVFQSCHFEGNQAAGGTGYGDIDIADFTIVGGHHSFEDCTFNASTSDYNIRFPAPATYHPPCVLRNNYFVNTPLHSGKHIKVQTYTGLLDLGGNRFQSTRAAAYDNPGNLRESGYNSYSGTLDTVRRFTGSIRLNDSSDASLIEMVPGSGSKGRINFANGANLRGDSTQRLKTDDGFMALGGLTNLTKAGAPVDGDMVGGAAVGGQAVDTTNSLFYVRFTDDWHPLAKSGAALTESAEANSTPVAGGSTTAPGANIRRYAFFTLPTTEKWYIITGIEIKNGATISGNVYCGVDLVDANPPSSDFTKLVAWGGFPHSGISVVQRFSLIGSTPIRGGTVLGVWFAPDSATATFAYTVVSSTPNSKNVTASSLPLVESAVWANSVNQFYLKCYYRGIS